MEFGVWITRLLWLLWYCLDFGLLTVLGWSYIGVISPAFFLLGRPDSDWSDDGELCLLLFFCQKHHQILSANSCLCWNWKNLAWILAVDFKPLATLVFGPFKKWGLVCFHLSSFMHGSSWRLRKRSNLCNWRLASGQCWEFLTTSERKRSHLLDPPLEVVEAHAKAAVPWLSPTTSDVQNIAAFTMW